MINKRTIFEIHRLKDMQFSIRQIAKTLNLDRGTVATAIADRLVYNSEILIMEGESYRKRS
jgi:DNA replication protein DnaC